MARTVYKELQGGAGLTALLGVLGLFILAGLASAWYMENEGHIVTGMTNRIVWGTPHVFAVFLIVTASGVLNIASLGSVFGRTPYKPMARLSGLLAIAFLIGGLAVLVLDLGRPDRLIVAMTEYNFKSIFSWNIMLYIGFLGVVAAYLFVQMERSMNRYVKSLGLFAFIWRLVLTTGTGSIFGWLVAREAYDAAVMAPLFIAMSLSFGLAAFLLILMTVYGLTGRPLGNHIVNRASRLLGIFAAAVLYFTALQHMTNLYAAEHAGVERFILLEGGIYTALFWAVQVVLGGLVPIALVFAPATAGTRTGIAAASALVIAGGLAQIYVIIIGGQATPLILFPGMEVQSSYQDGVVAAYMPSLPEIGLGIGGVALALAIAAGGMKVLRFLPENLGDDVVDPHHSSAPAVNS
jgi:molybdopterin-containing oxidoreductase family membrane subunit